MMWGYGGWMGLGGGILMIVSALLFLGLIAYVVVRYVDRGGRGDRAGTEVPSAEQLLASRFAAGEIDEQDYRHRLGILREHTGPLTRR